MFHLARPLKPVGLALAVVLLASACGGSAPTQTVAESPRPLARPDAEPSGSSGTGTEAVARTVDADDAAETPDEADAGPLLAGCYAVADMLAGSGARAFHEADFEDAMAMAHEAFSAFGYQAVELALDLATAVGRGEVDGMIAVYRQLDELSAGVCDFPAGGAYVAVPGSVAVVAFCEVDSMLGFGDEADESDESCEAPPRAYPTELPCFEATGFAWDDLATGAGFPWEMVDCDTGAPVGWDHATADWVAA